MEIKNAKLEDIDEILYLGNSVNKFKVSDEVITFWPRQVLIDCIEGNNILIAKHNTEIVGFIIVNYNFIFKKAIIENIYVKPEFRGQEIGKKLLDKLTINLVSIGCKYICTFIQNRSEFEIQFYLNNNFNKGINCLWIDKILDNSFKN